MLFRKSVYDHLIEPRKKQTLQFLALSLVMTMLQAPIPYLTGYLIDQVLPSQHQGRLAIATSLLLALFAGYVLFSYLNSRFRIKVRRELMTELNMGALKGVLSMTYNQRLRFHNGDLVSRLTRDVVQLNHILPYGISAVVHHALLALVLLGVVFILNWQLSAMLIGMIPAAVLVYLKFDSALWKTSEAESGASSAKLSAVQETIESDAEVKSYQAEAFFLDHVHEQIDTFEARSQQRQLVDLKVGTVILGMPMLAVTLIWYFGGLKVMAGDISIGLIITYTSTLGMIVPSLIALVEYASSVPNEITAFERVLALSNENEPPLADQSATGTSPRQSVQQLTLNDISFSYDSRYPLFRELSLRFEHGCAYLINGGNGAGKSTLLTLLSGSLLPEAGQVRLDQTDIHALPQRSQWITYVPQRIHIISASVYDNVTLGAAYDDRTVTEVLNQVGLGDWLARLENGVHHKIINAQRELSGGQVQKIGLARALLRDTPVLLMDEPTNNLDSQAVKSLIELLQQKKGDRIIIAVSHDDRIFAAVDRVIYLENSDTNQSTRVVEK